MTTITLTPEQARFAAEAVAQGRYRDLAEVVEVGLTLLRRAEAERAAFVASPEDAEAEGERNGFPAADEVHREMTAVLDEFARCRA
jgi:putative addiction module CopG family antidote